MYPIGYVIGMGHGLIEAARQLSGLSQQELADRAGTSRSTLSAYEHGRKSPTLTTLERMMDSAGFRLAIEPRVTFREVDPGRGRPFFVPDRLWRLPLSRSFARVRLPMAVNWSKPDVEFEMADRGQRSRCYEVVLREGMPHHILEIVDGALLVDLWREIVLPRVIRVQWEPVIESALS